MLPTKGAFLAVIIAVIFTFCDGRRHHVKLGRNLKHHEKTHKKNIVHYGSAARLWEKQIGRGCCSQGNAPAPFAQQQPIQQQFGQQQPIQQSFGQQPFACCQASSPPPCCQQAMPQAMPQVIPQPSPGCCSNAQPSATGSVDNSCCQIENPPQCCFGLKLKPGQSKNVSMVGRENNFLLKVELLDSGSKTAPTAVPSGGSSPTTSPSKKSTDSVSPTYPKGTPSSGPSKGSAALSGPSKGSTASSGPSKGSTASAGTSKGSTKGTTASSGPSVRVSDSPDTASSATPTSAGHFTECQNKALAKHNAKRLIHGVPGLTLDAELNKAAQDYAKKLANKKRMKHASRSERQGAGENLAKKCSKPDSGFDCGVASDNWYKEVMKYDWESPGYSQLENTGHFSQLVWKGSLKLGIGKASFVDDTGMTCHVVVGRYKDAGNVQGTFPDNVLRGKFYSWRRRSHLHARN